MSDKRNKRTEKLINLGIYGRKGSGGITAAEIIALALSLIWILGVIVFFAFAPAGDALPQPAPVIFVMKFLAIFLPIAVIWVGAMAARSSRIMRTESARLQAAIDAMRQTYVAQAQSGITGVQPSVEKKLDEIAAAQKQTETAIATFSTTRTQPATIKPAAKPAHDNSDQTNLALGTTAEDLAEPISTADFIRALNFPETADDRDGFTALRRALKDRNAARLIQAAQDVLTLLSQEGIYMDDLKPDLARPEIWRKFAAGERGREIAQLGGVRDRSSLALSSGRMRQDAIFRDAVHHFLREFDKAYAEFASIADDLEITQLSETRTARAFMLLGRVTGTFD
ncbi:MAG TPA: hypothetical protein DD729_04520 [Rhodobacteraceae bacterium]|jgi:hypothetical protein|nr:hypothetical protein [Paracoccaceae bacterium]